jgi:hypothetical protein
MPSDPSQQFCQTYISTFDPSRPVFEGKQQQKTDAIQPKFTSLLRYGRQRGGPSLSEGGLGAPPTVDPTQEGVNMLADAGGIGYGEYLQLDKILDAQEPQSRIHGGERENLQR